MTFLRAVASVQSASSAGHPAQAVRKHGLGRVHRLLERDASETTTFRLRSLLEVSTASGRYSKRAQRKKVLLWWCRKGHKGQHRTALTHSSEPVSLPFGLSGCRSARRRTEQGCEHMDFGQEAPGLPGRDCTLGCSRRPLQEGCSSPDPIEASCHHQGMMPVEHLVLSCLYMLVNNTLPHQLHCVSLCGLSPLLSNPA